MSGKIIELVQVLVDRIEKNGYQQRAREENAFDLNKRLTEAEGWAAHWKQARQDAHEAGELMKAELEKLKSRHAALANEAADDKLEKLRVFAEFRAAHAEIETLRGAMAADDKRLRDAEARIWPERTLGCDAPDAMADEILHLRQQLDAANRFASTVASERDAAHAAATAQQHDEIAGLRARLERSGRPVLHTREQLNTAKRAASDEFVERQVLTVEQQQDAAAWQQQVDSANAEVIYLRARLDEERSVSARLREQLDATNAAWNLQCAGIERLQAFVWKVRSILPSDSPYSNQLLGIEAALKTLDAGTEPTPVAEPLDAEGNTCPEN